MIYVEDKGVTGIDAYAISRDIVKGQTLSNILIPNPCAGIDDWREKRIRIDISHHQVGFTVGKGRPISSILEYLAKLICPAKADVTLKT